MSRPTAAFARAYWDAGWQLHIHVNGDAALDLVLDTIDDCMAAVRAASVLNRKIPLSLHSDLPMGPAAPLALASFAVNRRTPSGRIAGPEQRISVHDALRAVTIEAAYSWRMEHELGSITAGKAATFTVLAEDPYEVDPGRLGDIAILGTVYQGRWFPVAVSG